MRKFTKMSFFQELKYSSVTKADMKEIEEYYEEFVEALFKESSNPSDLIEFYNQLCFIRVEFQESINDANSVNRHLPKNRYLNKALELLEFQLNLTEKRLVVTFKAPNRNRLTNNFSNYKIIWTGSTVELVELGYALLAAGSVNDGDVDIKKLMEFLCSIFDFEMKDYYHAYHKIKGRAGDRTLYIDKLKDKFLNKMERDEEKARRRH